MLITGKRRKFISFMLINGSETRFLFISDVATYCISNGIMSTLKVYVSGGSHMSSGDSRAEKIRSELGGSPDIIFIENAKNSPPDLRDRTWNWIATPLILIGVYYWSALLKLGKQLGRSDTEILSSFPDSEIKDVDKHYQHHISRDRLIWAVMHYTLTLFAGFGMFEFLIPSGTTSLVMTSVHIVVFLIGLPFLVGSTFMIGTFRIRDYIMFHQIEKFAINNKEYDSACFIIGGYHEEKVKQLIDESPYLELVR